MFKLVISYDHRTKKCQAGPGIEGIETEIKTKFFVNKPFHLQYFDKEVDEFIDLDSIDDLSCDEYTKLRVITTNMDNTPLSPNLARSDTPVECPSMPILVNGSRPTTPLSVSSLSSTSASLDISDYRPVTPPLPKLCSPPGRSSSANMTEKTSPSTDVKSRKLKQWPKTYTFPYHMTPVSTRTKLENKQAIMPKDRRDILTGIYQDLTSFEGGLYPTSERYNVVIDAIFREFPDIPLHEGLDASNSRDLWKERLRVKFQNSRQRVDGDLPEIVAKKKKKMDNSGPKDLGSLSTTWGLVNYLPEKLESEDETSIQSHIMWLKKEHRKKESMDMEGVDRRMLLTLSHRRRLIIEESKSINDILIEYPWLGSLPWLINEFLRLGPKLKDRDIMNTFDTNLKKYAGAVESLTKNRKTAKFANESRLRINDFRSESERTYVESCCTVLGLPCLFKEDIKHILMTDVEYQISEEPARVAICYEKDILGIGKDEFKFAVEGVIVFKCSNFLKAIVGMMMAIYTFNLAYPKELHKTLLLLQKVFLCLDDECSSDKKILNVMSLINQAM